MRGGDDAEYEDHAGYSQDGYSDDGYPQNGYRNGYDPDDGHERRGGRGRDDRGYDR